jgi:transcriptional regulator with XRE-family HTH domain
MPRPLLAPSSALMAKIQKLLALRGLSLSEVSRASRSLSPENRSQHIPHNLYSSLRNRVFSPNLYQVFALSVLSNYRFTDWLAVFGFFLHDVPRLQAGFSALRTVELDAGTIQHDVSIPWFGENRPPDFAAPLMPLTHWLGLTSRAVRKIAARENGKHRYIKIGSQDSFAFPLLLPGSIVRITVAQPLVKPHGTDRRRGRKLFLIELGSGLVCAEICGSPNGNFVLCSRHLPFAPVELKEGRDAILVGTADLEIRPLEKFVKPVVSGRLGRFWTPVQFSKNSQATHVGNFIRNARLRAGLSFREASQRTKVVAKRLGDPRYYCAAGSLSDYETRRLPPRHIHKLISICTVYFASVREILEAAGISPEKAGTLPMPDDASLPPPANTRLASGPSRFFGEMERRIGKLPYFLYDCLGALFGRRNLSVRDVFWAGGIPRFAHHFLRGALFLVVDRKRKRPRTDFSCPKWAQPVYIVQQRGGAYLCGFCSLENGTLLVRACSKGLPKLLRLRNRIDAEVVGQVVGVARRLS